MKKIIALLLVLCLFVPFGVFAEEAPAIKLGQVQWAAHGTKCFAVMTVVLEGDKIVAALIDEYQVGAGMVGEVLALEMVDTFLKTPFSGEERHQRRIDKMEV